MLCAYRALSRLTARVRYSSESTVSWWLLSLALLVLCGCNAEPPPEPQDALPTISLKPTHPYRTVRSIPLVANSEKFGIGSQVLIKGQFDASELDDPVTIVRADIRSRRPDGGWRIENAAATTDVAEGKYEIVIEAPAKAGNYELHINVLDQLYIGRCEFKVVSVKGSSP